MPDVLIRGSEPADASSIADIYNHYIRSSTATFDLDEKTVEERTSWLVERAVEHPVLVAVDASGRLVGWGALSPWALRPAWVHTCEVAVYLDPEARGKGVGPRLLSQLIDAARAAGHHALVSQIVSENTASLRMTERAGFTRVGTLREVGRKFDRWLDVVIMELVL